MNVYQIRVITGFVLTYTPEEEERVKRAERGRGKEGERGGRGKSERRKEWKAVLMWTPRTAEEAGREESGDDGRIATDQERYWTGMPRGETCLSAEQKNSAEDLESRSVREGS